MRLQRVLSWFLGASLMFGASAGRAVAADAFPSRPISLTVPFGAGSTTDIYGRVVAEALSTELGQPVVVENKPGAGGSLGIGTALRASPDGHALMLLTTSTVAINGALYTNLRYSPGKDIYVAGITSTTPNGLVVPSAAGVNTFAEFAKRVQDGKEHFYNSQGNGTSQHLSAVLLARTLKFQGRNVPYNGQEGINGMLGGQTEFAFASVPSILGLVKGGKLKLLAVTGSSALPAMPEVPTLASLGHSAFASSEIWYGIGVSNAAPKEVKERLAKALAKLSADPKVQERLAQAGFIPRPAQPDRDRQAFVDSQLRFWSDLVKESGITIE